MADMVPGASPFSILTALLQGVNQGRQQRQQQGGGDGGFVPSGGPGAYGSFAPQWQPGGAGFGQYEGNIHTRANPMGHVRPTLGAANPPSEALMNYGGSPPMPRPRPPMFGGPMGTNPFSVMPPTSVGQVPGPGGP